MSARARRAVVDHVPPAWIAEMPVERWMRRPVVTIGVDTPVREAGRLMRERGIRHLPVLDGEVRLVGIVTDRDLRHVAFDIALGRVDASGQDGGDLPVRDVMTWGVVTVAPAADLRAAIAVMRERRLGALPVVEGGHVVGILTERDLLDALQALLRDRVVRPGPATGEPGGTYDAGMEAPPDKDPWQNSAAID
jgi:CBS domain-containing protein